jgi:phosphate starvation-inducible PhoH-like protein
MAVPDAALLALLGRRDENLREAEELLEADVHLRGNALTLSGTPADVAFAERVFTELITLAERGQQVAPDNVRRTVEMLGSGEDRLGESPAEVLSLDILSRRGKTIRPKTLNQKRYVDAIDANTIVFGIGPAGTGKTYLAMAKAVQALQAKTVNRIILTRPAVEAGERLGYLPGTLYEKIDPYLRPLYDALHDMIDPESIPKLTSAGTIEVAPLAICVAEPSTTLHHPRRGAEHHARADEDVPHPPRLRLEDRGDGRRHAGRPARLHPLRAHRRARHPRRGRRRALLPALQRRRRPPPAGGRHRRRLRPFDAAQVGPDLRSAAPRTGPPQDRRTRRRS